MKYFKKSQFVPGKGEAWMYYECDDALLVQRYVTHIPTTNETEKVSDPVIKTLFRPELLTSIPRQEFLDRWSL